MTRRQLLCEGMAGLMLAVTLFVLLTYPRPGVTLDNFRRLKQGMTRSEVDAVLGSRPLFSGGVTMGYIAVWDEGNTGIMLHFVGGRDAQKCELWRGEVSFEGGSHSEALPDLPIDAPRPFDRFRGWLGW